MALLHLSDECRTSLEFWAQAGYPYESCGLLIGTREREAATVKRVTQAKNLSTEPARNGYILDPQDFLKADDAARTQCLEVLGVWHSHPDHAALPSETDLVAAWPDWSYVIVAVSSEGVQDLRAWRLNGDRAFDEELIQP